MPRLSKDLRAFRADVATKLGTYAKENFRSTAAAAKSLGISKQRLAKYLAKKALPKPDFLDRVATKWRLQFKYRGSLLPFGAFAAPFESTTSVAEQWSLFDVPQIARNEDLEVVIKRKDPNNATLVIEIRRRASA